MIWITGPDAEEAGTHSIESAEAAIVICDTGVTGRLGFTNDKGRCLANLTRATDERMGMAVARIRGGEKRGLAVARIRGGEKRGLAVA
ncbi:hypothetical protein V500_10634 [Pseudogymnoascus sp. VKM F-4518 (FW-2643)]|nr:hypothetical protein V500_10634 [Pseudogymnoascus sp. VKM F-4518 (FW-2643)]